MLISEKEELLKELKSLRLTDRTVEERADIRSRIIRLEAEIKGKYR